MSSWPTELRLSKDRRTLHVTFDDGASFAYQRGESMRQGFRCADEAGGTCWHGGADSRRTCCKVRQRLEQNEAGDHPKAGQGKQPSEKDEATAGWRLLVMIHA